MSEVHPLGKIWHSIDRRNELESTVNVHIVKGLVVYRQIKGLSRLQNMRLLGRDS